jgi:hypothetical protein
MNIKKFNEKMGRKRFIRGGYIKRKNFDSGGIAANAIAPPITGGNLTNTNTQGIGGISSALGLNAASANITPGTNSAQLNNAYQGANNAINAQVGLTNTLTPQAQAAVNAQNQILAEQQAIAQGAGPNPAQAQLAQATGTNVANQAALAAGQRGGAGNVGLLERQAAQQGVQAQQGAAGQAATLEAQQQIAAQQNAAQLAAQQIAQTQGATTNLNTAQQNEQNILQNANAAQNNAAVGMQSNINNVNAQNNQGILGGITSGLSSLTGGLLAEGGEVHPVHGKAKLEFLHKIAKMGMEHYATGGSTIGGNPLIGAIANSPAAVATTGYAPVSQAAGPNIASAPQSNVNLGQNIASGLKAGKNWKQNRQNQNDVNNAPQLQQPELGSQTDNTNQNALGVNPTSLGTPLASNLTMPNLGSGIDTSQTNETISQGDNQYQNNQAHGGSIFDLHPTEHAKMAATHFAQYFSGGGEAKKIPAMVSPGERFWNKEEVEMIKHGADPSKLGTVFPGKDKVPGKDTVKNDTVPTELEEGGVVSPLHVEKTKDPDKMRLFVLKSLKATGKHMKRPDRMK